MKVMYVRKIHTSPKDKHQSGRRKIFVAVDEFIIITMVFCES